MYGAGSQESLEFHLIIYHLTQQIPRGKVTTYGHLAFLAGNADNSRQAGYALKHLATSPTAVYNTTNVPWWRVLGSGGKVSPRPAAQRQIDKLSDEIEITPGGKVDLATTGWFPNGDDLDFDFQPLDHSA